MAKRIIKPDSGNTLVLQEDNGSIDALTVETNGNTTLGGNLVIPDSGTIGSASDTDAITIDSSGNVGIGVTVPDSKLQVATTQFDPSLARTTAAIIVRSESGSTTGDGQYSGAITFGKIDSSRPFGSIAGVQIGSDIDSGGLAFFTKDGTSTNDIVSEAMRIDSSGNVELKTTNAKLILPSGGGISFENHSTSTATGASSTASANVLDDYEEGTWTGYLQTSNNDIAGSGLSKTGSYIKIGNLVFFNIYFAASTITSGTGALILNGLPFNNQATYYPWVYYGHGNLLTASNGGYIQVSSDSVRFIQRDSTAAAAFTTGAGTKYAMVSGSYISA